MATFRLTADLTPVEGGHIQAQLVELPGVIACTPAREHVIAQLADALGEYVRADAPEPLPPAGPGAMRVSITVTLACDQPLVPRPA